MNTLEKLQARKQTVNVYLNLLTLEVSISPQETENSAWALFVMRRLAGTKADIERAVILKIKNSSEPLAGRLLASAAQKDAAARSELEAWRAKNNKSAFEDEPIEITNEDILDLMHQFVKETLAQSMVEPTFEKCGGLAGLGDVAPVLADAALIGFRTVEQVNLEAAKAEQTLVTIFPEIPTS